MDGIPNRIMLPLTAFPASIRTPFAISHPCHFVVLRLLLTLPVLGFEVSDSDVAVPVSFVEALVALVAVVADCHPVLVCNLSLGEEDVWHDFFGCWLSAFAGVACAYLGFLWSLCLGIFGIFNREFQWK